MSRRFTKQNTYKNMEIQIPEDGQADVRILESIADNIDKAMDEGAGKMVVYDVILPRQYAHQDNKNQIFSGFQADICKFQKRLDGAPYAPRYIAVRDRIAESPVYKVAMFLPPESNFDREQFESKGRYVMDGKLKDWQAYREHDLMAICEKHGVAVKDVVPLDRDKEEARNEAFYCASKLAAVKVEPKAERTLFRSRKSNN